MSLTDFHRNCLVEASAGTGKTYSLVARIVGGLCAGVYSIENSAAVTFTRKASAELSQRLRIALEQQNPPLLPRFPEMFVGTVHSLGGRILRQFPVESGLSPDFRELEEVEDRRLQRVVLRAQIESEKGRRVLRTLREVGASVRDLFPAMTEMSDRGELPYHTSRSERPELTGSWQGLEQFAQSLSALGLPDGCKLTTAHRELESRLAIADRGSPGELLRVLGLWESEVKPLKRCWGKSRQQQDNALEPVLRLVSDFREQTVRAALFGWRCWLYSEITPFLVHVRQAAQEERRARGVVNYSDLLVGCQTLLRRHPQVLSQLQRQFRHLFVDEFQDTDPLQAELFLLLAADGECQDWRQASPRPASLFLVGDPKQSIYRFRHADIATYQFVRERLLTTGGEVLPLSRSYRANHALCSWTNRVFSRLLPEVAQPVQASFAPLHPAREVSGDGPAIYTLTTGGSRAQEVTGTEAERIAAWISRQGPPFSRFMILTSRRADTRPSQRALERLGIPIQTNPEPELIGELGQELLRVLAVLTNPLETISLAAVLRGTCFGHSDSELFQHVQRHGMLRLEESDDGPVAASLNLLTRLRQKVRTLPPGAAARAVAMALGLSELGSDWQAVADALAELGERGLSLAQGVADLQVEESEILPVPSPSGDAVRILNLHTAKGLEAPVVFLAAPTQGLPLHVEHGLDDDGSGAFCLRRFRKPFAHPAHWAEIEEREREFLEAERVRLLYVAVTRAQERLIVGRWSGPVGSSPRPWLALESFLEGCPELEHSEPVAPGQRVAALDTGEALRRQELRARQTATCQLPSWRRHTVSTSNQKVGFQPTLAEDLSLGQGREWGHLLHRLLEQMTKNPAISPEELLLLARWYSLETPELAPYLEAAVQQLQRVRETSFWSDVLCARQRLAEVPFGQAAGDARIFGVIDLVLARDEGWDIVDYKTDRKRMEDLLLAYAPQLEQYARSWAEISGDSVRSAGIFGVREGHFGRVGE